MWSQTAAIAEEAPPIWIQSHLPMPLLTEAQHSPKLVQYQCLDPLTPKFHPPIVPWAHLCPCLDLHKRQGWGLPGLSAMPAGVAAGIGKFPVYKTILTVYLIRVTQGLVQIPFLCWFHLSGSRMRVNLGSTNVASSAHLRSKAAPDCSMPTAGGTSGSL